MDLARAQATASSEGLVLVFCAGNATGFKGVQAHGSGFRGFYSHGGRGQKVKRYTRLVDSANEAALELSRKLRWGACECRVCAPPAPLPAARDEDTVIAAATQALLTLARSEHAGSGYKGVLLVRGPNPSRSFARENMMRERPCPRVGAGELGERNQQEARACPRATGCDFVLYEREIPGTLSCG